MPICSYRDVTSPKASLRIHHSRARCSDAAAAAGNNEFDLIETELPINTSSCIEALVKEALETAPSRLRDREK
jgi:hypothetical protein